MKDAPSPTLVLLSRYLSYPYFGDPTKPNKLYLPNLLYSSKCEPVTMPLIQLPDLQAWEGGPIVQIKLDSNECAGLSNITITKIPGDVKDGTQPDVNISGDTATFNAHHPDDDNGYTIPEGVPSSIICSSANLQWKFQDETQWKSGSATVTISAVDAITGTFNIDVTDPKNVKVKFSAFGFSVSPDKVKIDVDLQSAFTATINSVLNNPDNLALIVPKIEAAANNNSVLLSAISGAATTLFKSIAPGGQLKPSSNP